MAVTLEGKTALVTGSGTVGGMGRSHAVLMSERGADVIVHDINEDGANETAELVRANGQKASTLIADVRDVPGFTAKIKEAEAEHGKIDILVNNAGVTGNKLAMEDVDVMKGLKTSHYLYEDPPYFFLGYIMLTLGACCYFLKQISVIHIFHDNAIQINTDPYYKFSVL